MISDSERDQIRKLVSRQYEISKFSEEGNTLTFAVEGLDSYPEENFSMLVDDLSSIGFLCFTTSPYRNQITVIRSLGTRKNSYTIRLILLILSLGSSIYVGFHYVEGYTGSNDILSTLGTSLVEFALPLFLILLSRELTRFFIMAKNGMNYSLPVFVPDPLGLGTMGFINTPRQPYKSRQAMIETGAGSLIAGFASSIVVIFIGSFFSISNPPASPSINSPVQLLSSPLIFQLLFNRVMPSLGVLDPIAYAGWIGIVVNSFNAFPAGYLDGGLIATALFGNRSVYLSYASIVAIIGLGIIYPPWVLLAIFIVLLGIKGPEPLFNVSRIYVPAKALAVVAFAILLLGMVPFPYHIVNSNFEVQMQNQDNVIVNGTHQNVSLRMLITNSGGSSVVPAFSISPVTQLKVQGPSKTLGVGENATYLLTIPFWKVNRTGVYNYTITTYSGETSKSIPVQVILMNLTDTLYLNPNPYYATISENKTANFTESNNGLVPLYLHVVSFADPGVAYMLTGSNLTIHLQPQVNDFPITLNSGVSIQLSVKSLSGTGNITIVTYDRNYSGTIVHITVKPPPRSSTFSTVSDMETAKLIYTGTNPVKL